MAETKLYGADDILKAKRAMLDHLTSLSGGELILGCCTQGCCGGELAVEYRVMPDLNVGSYSAQDMLEAKRAMLSTLVEISGGNLILGCCTQGCCDDGAVAALINVP